MAEYTPSSEFYWDVIFIRVEDWLFCVPRFEFVKSSEVFADMFLLPSGPGANTEGQDKDHPIVLEGYKKEEFSCLLKVMYPTAGSLISDITLNLCLGNEEWGEEEWVSVLKLSTIWNMEKIRKYAIHKLSTDFILSPIEKIRLARAHAVDAWMREGIAALVTGDQLSTLDELATLGWETAARILWISHNSPHSAYLRILPAKFLPENTLYFIKDAVKCMRCSSSILVEHDSCRSCGKAMPADAELTAPGPGTFSLSGDNLVLLRSIECSYLNCRQSIIPSPSFNCCSCSQYVGNNGHVKITPKGLYTLIEETFGEEFGNYKAV